MVCAGSVALHLSNRSSIFVPQAEQSEQPLEQTSREPDPMRTYKCPRCPITFSSLPGCKRHFTRAHRAEVGGDPASSNARNVCEHCGKVYTTKDMYYAHVLEAHGIEMPGLKTYPCTVCGEVFHVRVKLASHMMLHTGKRKSCSDCDYKTRFPGNLRKHRRNVHERKEVQT